ncbi:hypothetical protein EHQ53_14710 [Leptospira langatensis]|uniref:Uncharacterized protein n=2 Tax=Leptospira langatensis TaxID=2484983 RepID=A0A5F1ZPW9_9LEPT|nr:hypothetical protein EHO57_07950 [Leptospira langatensis]TGL39529.1 hypothetical protein EHQ53_14710 [Leptospira langatensis]
MIWDIGTQDKIVYLIVGVATIYLTFPLVSSFKSIFGKSKTAETRFGCYEDACASCHTIAEEKPSSLRKRKNA